MSHHPAVPILSHIRRLAEADPPGSPTDADCLERFSARGEEAAFETLVRRHGPMVYRVCRSTLNDAHAAEDAFQATFLVLARRAGAVRQQHSLASWLYKVARRIVVNAGERSAERLRREVSTTRRPVADPLDEVSWREVQSIFLDELGKLPERYRAPVLLCCLEGKTRDEAAAQLGVATGTLKLQLERARKRLRDRLARRGLGLSAGLVAALLDSGEAAAVTPSLVAAAVRASNGAAGVVPPRVREMSRGATGFAAGYKLTATALAFAGVLAAAAGWGFTFYQRAAETAAPAAAVDDRVKSPGPGAGGKARVDADGDPLPAGAISRLGTLRLRHGAGRVSFMPDGKMLVSQAWNDLRFWEVATGKQVHALRLTLTRGTIGWSPLSRDGKLFATVSDAGVEVHDISSAKPVRSLRKGKYTSIDVTADGKLLAAGFIDPPLWVPATPDGPRPPRRCPATSTSWKVTPANCSGPGSRERRRRPVFHPRRQTIGRVLRRRTRAFLRRPDGRGAAAIGRGRREPLLQ